MAETYYLRSTSRLEGIEIQTLSAALKGKYEFGNPEWREGESLTESGWHYPILSQKEISVEDLDVLREKKGLTLLLTESQAAELAPLVLSSRSSDLSKYPVDIRNPNQRPRGKN